MWARHDQNVAVPPLWAKLRNRSFCMYTRYVFMHMYILLAVCVFAKIHKITSIPLIPCHDHRSHSSFLFLFSSSFSSLRLLAPIILNIPAYLVISLKPSSVPSSAPHLGQVHPLRTLGSCVLRRVAACPVCDPSGTRSQSASPDTPTCHSCCSCPVHGYLLLLNWVLGLQVQWLLLRPLGVASPAQVQCSLTLPWLCTGSTVFLHTEALLTFWGSDTRPSTPALPHLLGLQYPMPR